MKTVIISKNDSNQRLDKFLSKLLPTMHYSLIYKYIRKKRVKVNSAKSSIEYRLQEGDVLELYINDEFFEQKYDRTETLNIKYDLSVVYEDDNILVVNKPTGLLVHEDEGEKVHTLISYIKAYLYQKGEYDPIVENSFAPSLCHRIDRNTSGLVIAAKNAEALRVMNEKIKYREIDKFYICVVEGVPKPKSGVLDNYLWKDSKQNRVYVYDEPKKGAKRAVTEYKTIKTENGKSEVEVRLISGRTHQIRAQFAHIGTPLTGDGKYGVIKDRNYKHQMLCAYKLVFNFSAPGGELEYLKGMEFKITPPFSV